MFTSSGVPRTRPARPRLFILSAAKRAAPALKRLWSRGRIHDLERYVLVRFASIDNKAQRRGSDKSAVHLPFRVERVVRRGAGWLAGFRAASAFEVEDVLVGTSDRDDFNHLSGRRRNLRQQGETATLLPAVAEDRALDDLLTFMEGHWAVFGRAGSPFQLLKIDVDRNHTFLHLNYCGSRSRRRPASREVLSVEARSAAVRDDRKREMPVMR